MSLADMDVVLKEQCLLHAGYCSRWEVVWGVKGEDASRETTRFAVGIKLLVGSFRQQDGSHGSRNPLRSV